MHETRGILVGKGEAPQHLLFAMANRHGLIAGATGTGKTVSVRILAEGLAHGATKMGCCYSTSKICAPCWSTSRPTPPS